MVSFRKFSFSLKIATASKLQENRMLREYNIPQYHTISKACVPINGHIGKRRKADAVKAAFPVAICTDNSSPNVGKPSVTNILSMIQRRTNAFYNILRHHPNCNIPSLSQGQSYFPAHVYGNLISLERRRSKPFQRP